MVVENQQKSKKNDENSDQKPREINGKLTEQLLLPINTKIIEEKH